MSESICTDANRLQHEASSALSILDVETSIQEPEISICMRIA